MMMTRLCEETPSEKSLRSPCTAQHCETAESRKVSLAGSLARVVNYDDLNFWVWNGRGEWETKSTNGATLGRKTERERHEKYSLFLAVLCEFLVQFNPVCAHDSKTYIYYT